MEKMVLSRLSYSTQRVGELAAEVGSPSLSRPAWAVDRVTADKYGYTNASHVPANKRRTLFGLYN
jgi:hypothetical protein